MPFSEVKSGFATLLELAIASPRKIKVGVIVSCDVCTSVVATWFSYYLRVGTVEGAFPAVFYAGALSIVLFVPIFTLAGSYKFLYRFTSLAFLRNLLGAFFVYFSTYSVLVLFWGITGLPRTMGLIQPLVFLIGLIGFRLVLSILLRYRHGLGEGLGKPARVLIYGAGTAGNQLASLLRSEQGITVVGFCDDDTRLHGRYLNGFRILDPSRLSELITSTKATHVILAIPSVSIGRKQQILKCVERCNVIVRTLPSALDLVDGRVSLNDIRELSIFDLLGRDTVAPDNDLIESEVTGRVILVTGAGGSIGSEICRQMIKFQPRMLLLVEANEFVLYQVHSELEELTLDTMAQGTCELIPVLASILNEKKIESIVRRFRPDTIYHAAAYKHVAMAERNVGEVVRNNVLGTAVIAEVAIACAVPKVVLVSTDKAVRPTSLMGASKRLAEMILQALDSSDFKGKTCFAIVRFGNVLGSSGSVIPKFQRQIREGGPVTVTHPDVVRYFMTIPEAAQLVIQSSAIAQGGDVFLLDMGSPVKILEVAKKMIRLSGLLEKTAETGAGDIEIKITGLRPGEKLYEELLIDNDPLPTQHKKIFRARENFIPWDSLKGNLESLQRHIDSAEDNRCSELVKRLVDGHGVKGLENPESLDQSKV